MGLKEIYYSLEEKYYSFVEWLDQFVPVNGLVDKIDSIVPSFPLTMAVLFALLVVTALVFTGGFAPQTTTLSILVSDQDGKPIELATVFASTKDGKFSSEQKTGADGIALFEVVSIGEEIDLIIEKQKFQKETTTVLVDTANFLHTINLDKEPEPLVPHFIEFSGPDGEKLSGKSISAVFECTNKDAALPERESVILLGEKNITPPSDCGFLIVRATAEGFEEMQEVLDLPAKTLRFSALPLPKGTARIFAKDFDTGAVLENMKVTVVGELGAQELPPAFTRNGEVSFSLVPGDYSANAEDSTGKYGTATVQFIVSANQTVTQTALLSKRLVATLKVSVKEKGTTGAIDGAKVFLKRNGKLFGERTISQGETQAVFAIAERGIYTYTASKEDFLSVAEKTIDLTITPMESVLPLEVELEKCTLDKCGTLKVRVVDEEANPVENAKVFLSSADTNSLAQELGEKITDSNGYTTAFQNIGARRVFANAQKYPASAVSASIMVNPLEAAVIEVRLVIGKGTLSVEAVNEAQTPLAFAVAEVFSTNNQNIGSISLDEQGRGSLALKADKEVFVVVKKDGFSHYVSVSRQIIKNSEVKVKAVLSDQSAAQTFKAVFLGLFDSSGQNLVTQTIEAGKTYIAKFNMIVPAQKSYSEAGLHIRTGLEADFDHDKLYIAKINAPLSGIFGSKTFTPPTGTAIDMQSLAAKNVKWANVVWQNVTPGIYNVEAEIKVKPETVSGTELPVFYRAYAVSATGFEREPADNVLLQNADSPAKNALYAQTLRQVFYEGAQKTCDQNFCFGERIVDTREGVVLTPPYRLRVFDNYDYSFSITNNSGQVHDKADIRIKNSLDGIVTDDTLSMERYLVANADSVSFTSTGPVFEITPFLSAGYFATFRSIEGKMVLQAKKLGPSALSMKIVSGVPTGVEIFSKQVQFEAIETASVKVSAKPEVPLAFKPITLEVLVEYSDGPNKEKTVQGARVIVTRADPQNFETTLEGVTANDGVAKIDVCGVAGCSPGTKFFIEVQKEGIASAKAELLVTDTVVEFEPREIEFNLNVANVQSEAKNLAIKNLIPQKVRLSRAVLRGNFGGILDTDKMNSFLQQFVGQINLEFDEEKTIRVLAELNDNAGLIEEPLNLRGSLLLDIEGIDDKTVWPMKEIPVRVKIDLAEPPAQPNCISISSPVWEDSVLETTSIKQFSIVNNCVTAQGKPMNLRNLQAQVEWASGEEGQIVLSVSNLTSGETSTQVLQAGYPTIVLEKLDSREEIIATLTFVPKQSKAGELADFKVLFKAELLTNAGTSFVNADKPIDGKLLIINLSGCIKANPTFGQVASFGTDGQGSFTISTESCGEIPIDLRFCYNDSGCSGGTSEGSIGVSPREFSNLAGEEKEVLVFRESIPGVYGVRVEARPRGGGWREIGEVLVLFEPPEGSNFKLSKYDYIIIGSGARDSATLKNSPLAEDILVDASACDWKTAEEEGFFSFAGAGVGAAVGAILGAKPAVDAAQAASQAVALPKFGVSTQAITQTTAAETAAKSAQTAATQAIPVVDAANLEVDAIGPCPGLVAEDVEQFVAMKTAMADAVAFTKTANGSLVTSSASTSLALAKATQAQTAAAGGAGPTAAAQTSTAAGLLQAAATEEQTAFSTTEGACGQLTEAEAAVEIAQGNLAAYIPVAQAKFASWTTACVSEVPGACESASLCGQSIAAAQASVAGVGQALAAETAALSTCQPAATTEQTAATGLTAAGTQLTALSGQQAAMSGSFTSRFLAFEGLFAGLGFMGGGLLGGLMGDDPCDKRQQFPMTDYIINLKTDGLGVIADQKGIEGKWSTKQAHVFGDFDYQETGVVFTNTGVEDPRPVYRAFSFEAVKHSHSNPTVIRSGNSSFGPFNVPDVASETYVQKFHLRFKTGQTEDPLPDLGAGAQACVSGVNLGRTGEGALAKVKFDWNWKNFSQNSCDVANPNAIYCDATQFNFEINYRLDALREFLDKNREKLVCPENKATSFAGELTTGFAQEIQSGNLPSYGTTQGVSLSSYHFGVGKNELTVSAVVANDSDTPQDATVQVELLPPQGITVAQKTCTIQFSAIPKNSGQTKSCKFASLPESENDYSAKVKITDSTAVIEGREFEFRANVGSTISCWMPSSTEMYDGRPAIDYYIEAAGPRITWTQSVPDRQALSNLLAFDAYLIRDGFSSDFLNDFADYSNQVAFFDTPSFFNKIGTANGQSYGLDRYYKRGKIAFEKKYAEGLNELATGGIYRVEFNILFGGFWEMFDKSGEPASSVLVQLQLLSEPKENHVFYHLPLDGLVGLENETTFDRKGYGMGFTNEDPEKIVSLNSDNKGFKTFESSASSNPFVETSVLHVDSFFELNSNPVNRGALLSIENTGTQSKLRFSPSLATPIVMKVEGRQREDSFGAYYSLLDSSSKSNVGNVLTYWTGLGQCLDFSGEHVKEAFDEKPDRAATPDDRFVNWENTYTTQWQGSSKDGSVYLRTIFYSPPFRQNELKVEGPLSQVNVISPDFGPASVVSLNGISNMKFNSESSRISSIQDVLDLVKQGVLCETSTGKKVSYWWNPKILVEAEGQANCLNCQGKRSILKEETALVAGKACIGTN